MNSPLSSNSWIGRLIGDNQRYRLEQSLGGGGMGEVFLATDTRVGKEVALKLLKDKWLASGEMRKRFEREIKVCAALRSAHIIEISDCGVTEEGFPFYVMEYLRGQTLRYLMLREKQLSPEQTVKIIAQVCKGLQVAHQGVFMQRDGNNNPELIKVIHRDLKPDNIFLLPTDVGDWVKILDFGIAKIKSDSSEQTNLTKTFIGTFRYSSPEQIQNDKNIDTRADIYSLGIILYEMLSAADPFGLSVDGSRVSESSWLHAHGYRSPIPLKQQPGCEYLSSELEAVVIKCLQKKPGNRFASVEELRLALQAAIQPVTGSTDVQPRQIIIEPKQQQTPRGSYEETVSKQQQTPRGSYEETVSKQQQTPQGSYEETVSKQQQTPRGSYEETVPKQQNFEQQPPQSGSNNENIPKAHIPETTIAQQQPSNPQQAAPDHTIFQIRTPIGAEPAKPEQTIYQPRQGSNSSDQEVENTTVQPLQNQISAVTPENTIYQPRPIPFVHRQQKPENTIYQPRKNNFNILLIVSIALATVLLFCITYYLAYIKVQGHDNRDNQEHQSQ
ncbi:protein kinase [Nostoc linckia FACHB-104]|nr:protein kinase [Nostoc linckia FACHB-104]